jgi:hypothetical protein
LDFEREFRVECRLYPQADNLPALVVSDSFTVASVMVMDARRRSTGRPYEKAFRSAAKRPSPTTIQVAMELADLPLWANVLRQQQRDFFAARLAGRPNVARRPALVTRRSAWSLIAPHVTPREFATNQRLQINS